MQRIEVATVRLNQAVRALPGDGATMTQPLAAPRPSYVQPRRVLIGAATLAGAFACGYAVRTNGPQFVAAQPQDLAQAAVPCSVSYTISPAHDGRFEAALTVTNTGREPVPRWAVAFTQPGGHPLSATQTGPTTAQHVAAASGVAQLSQHDTTVILASNSTLDLGTSVTHTLHGRYTVGPTTMPAAFTLNGKRCDVTITTPPAPAQTVTAAPPVTVAQVSTPDKTPPGNTNPRSQRTKASQRNRLIRTGPRRSPQ